MNPKAQVAVSIFKRLFETYTFKVKEVSVWDGSDIINASEL